MLSISISLTKEEYKKLLNKDIDEIILYDQICFIKKSINGKQKITNKYGLLKYSEKDRIHIGNIKINNFIPGKSN